VAAHLRCAVHGILLHVLGHVRILDHSLSLSHICYLLSAKDVQQPRPRRFENVAEETVFWGLDFLGLFWAVKVGVI
jgi:hypothetical protein